jgi:hypothetical protein
MAFYRKHDMKPLSPISSFFHCIGLLAAGRLHFPRQRVGEAIILDGERWVVFRQAVVDPPNGQPARPGSIFRPRFHIAGMSVRQNKLFSLIPIPFFVGLPGFRSKLWLYQPESGDFSGYYEWDRVIDAENYRHSFAAEFMTRRSVPGSVSFQVIPQTEIKKV